MAPHRGGCRAGALFLVPAVFAACSGVPRPADPASLLGRERVSEIMSGYGAGNHAFGTGNWERAAEGYARAYAFNPKDDVVAYLAAASWARAGKPDAALEWLQRLVRSGSCLRPTARSFSAIEGDQRFREAAAALAARAPTRHRASPAFVVAEKDLVPEGIAWDPVERVFYLSSLWKRKIVRVTPGFRGAKATAVDFVPEGAGALDAVVGLKVDAKRRRLWAVSAAEPEMKGFVPEDDGRSALVAFDLVSKKRVLKIERPRTSPHFFNDLALDAAGNVYVTDTASTEILVLRAGSEDFETLVPKDSFVVPSGIVASEDGKHLWVADVARGTFHVDTKTGRVAPLDQPQGLFPAGLNGLVLHERTLIGILNVSVGLVARWPLAADGTSLGEGELLECGHPSFRLPTRGAVADGALYVVANGQSDAVVKGALSVDGLEDIVVLRLPL